MLIEIKVPVFPESVADGTIVSWHKQPGDVIKRDEIVIDDGAIFMPFTTVTSNVKIGKFFHANMYSYVAHDCVVGDFVTFGAHVQCNGRVMVGDHAYIGSGAIIRPGTPEAPMVIGEGATIGMGAVVTKSVLPHTTVVGNPASVLEKRENSGG